MLLNSLLHAMKLHAVKLVYLILLNTILNAVKQYYMLLKSLLHAVKQFTTCC